MDIVRISWGTYRLELPQSGEWPADRARTLAINITN